jgi:hypothetical protein
MREIPAGSPSIQNDLERRPEKISAKATSTHGGGNIDKLTLTLQTRSAEFFGCVPIPWAMRCSSFTSMPDSQSLPDCPFRRPDRSGMTGACPEYSRGAQRFSSFFSVVLFPFRHLERRLPESKDLREAMLFFFSSMNVRIFQNKRPCLAISQNLKQFGEILIRALNGDLPRICTRSMFFNAIDMSDVLQGTE